MSFCAFPNYKDSGIDWLPRIPTTWTVKKFRHLFRESPEKIENVVVGPMLSVSGYRGIELKEYEDENRRRSDKDLVGYRIVRIGQLVVNTMWMNYGGLGVSEYEGHVSPAYRSYEIDDALVRGFAHHLLRSSAYVAAYTRLLTGVRPNSLQMSRDDLMSFPVLVPPRDDQEQIAEFLNRETAKSNALVAEQERLIELLKEKRQAVISHAVTKGLNPETPMKDSRIEWLGKVPEHWKEVPLRAALSLKHGYAFDGEAFADSGELVLMTPGSFNERGGFRYRSAEKFYVGNDVREEFVLKQGQLLVAMTEQAPGLLGSALFVPGDRTYLHNQRLGLAQGIREDLVTAQFLFHLFNSERVRAAISVTATGAKVRHTSPSKILSVKVFLPPLAEQDDICRYIDEGTAPIETLEREVMQGLALLEERRAALISAAVTGQIDVRSAAARSAA